MLRSTASVICPECRRILIPRARRRLNACGDPVHICPYCGAHAYNPLIREAALLSPEQIRRMRWSDTLNVTAFLLFVGVFIGSTFFPSQSLLPFLFGAALLTALLKPWDFSGLLEESMKRLLENPERVQELTAFGQPCEAGSAYDRNQNSKCAAVIRQASSCDEIQRNDS